VGLYCFGESRVVADFYVGPGCRLRLVSVGRQIGLGRFWEGLVGRAWIRCCVLGQPMVLSGDLWSMGT